MIKNMIDQNTIFKIHILDSQGYSQREISRVLKISIGAISKYLKNPIKEKRKTIRPSKLDSFFTMIDKLIENYPDISTSAILNHIRGSGYKGSTTIISDYLAPKAGKILFRNRKELFLNKIKAELFRCMVKGISYENVITTLFYKYNNEYNLALNKEEREIIIKTGKRGNHKLWRYCVALDMKAVGFRECSIIYVLDIDRRTLKKI